MEIPVIDLEGLNDNLSTMEETMELLHQACEKWGFFKVSNHGVDIDLMEKVKRLVNLHYEEYMKKSFYDSEMAKGFESRNADDAAVETDWESSFFIWHRPVSNIHEFTNFSEDLCKAMEEYVNQVVELAEKLSEIMCENLGLEKGYMKKAFSGSSVGTKVAKYPKCPRPELVKGLRTHTDAGGIILLLQDDQVPGLEFFKDGKWVEIPPSTNNTIFINTGDQVEILSNGRYKSVLHRVMADENGSRLSIATFYNPAADAFISPSPQLLYPQNFRFQDYLKLYAGTKFSNKGSRFESMKKIASGQQNLLV